MKAELNGLCKRRLLLQAFEVAGARAMKFAGLFALLVGLALPAHAGQPTGAGGKKSFDAMSANVYIGGGIERIAALNPADPNFMTALVSNVTSVYYEIVASQPNVRLAGVADAIVDRMPDVVSIEEATLLRNQSPGDLIVHGTTPATNVVFDYVQILVDSLEARGAHYAVASVSEEWDVEMPMMNMQTGTIDDLRQTDREAILVRTDLPRGQFRVANPHHGNFTNLLAFPSIGLVLKRGWCSVDVVSRGQAFRYVCAHLEQESAPSLQILQARELVRNLSRTCLPVVLAGDFNCDPLHRDGSYAYDVFPGARYRDTWTALNPGNPAGGLTWGHDELLSDTNTVFDRRIDFMFARGGTFVPKQFEVIDLALERTQPPLWSSDHAAVYASFDLRRGPFGRIGRCW